MTKKPVLNIIIDVLVACILVGIDQYTKLLAVAGLKDKAAYPIFPGVLELNYLENRGAAFGMLQNQKWFFLFVAVIILSCIIYVLWNAPATSKYISLHLLLTFIAAGAIGNMIDRIRLNYVVDFIYFKLINFPIFNVADIYVTVCSILLVFLLLFIYKEEDLKFLNFRKNSYRVLRDNDDKK